MKFTYLILAFLLLSLMTNAQSIGIVSVQPITTSNAAQYSKYEIGVRLNIPTFSNPYDPNVVDVSATFTAPSGRVYSANAFWYKPFQRNINTPDPTINSSDPCDNNTNAEAMDPGYFTPLNTNMPWRIRFAPTETGTWTYRVTAKYNGNSAVSNNFSFNVEKSSNKGYIGVDKRYHPRNFIYKNSNAVFFPMGVNVVKPYTSSTQYNRGRYKTTIELMTGMAANGGNFIRIWMSPWHFGIEWKEDGVNRYETRQNRAFDLDDIFSYAEQNGIYIQLCLSENWEFFDNNAGHLWLENPYRSLLSSQLQDDFFSDSKCIDNYEKRVRYIIARWGYSTNLFSYELFNEVDQAGPNYWNGLAPTINKWDETIIAYAKQLDNNHLYTTSCAGGSAGNYLYPSQFIDYVQEHDYSIALNVEFQRNYYAQRDFDLFGKPLILGEYDSHVDSCWLGTGNFTNLPAHNKIEMHNSLWSTSVSGYGGGGLNYSGPDFINHCWGGQYEYFAPLSNFINNEDFFQYQYKSIASECLGDGPKDLPGGNPSPHLCAPTNSVGGSINPSYVLSGITTSNNNKIEVFGLKNQNKVIGWIHNKDSYWYLVPRTTPSTGVYCTSLNDNQPISPSAVAVLENEKLTLTNLPCDGVYKVEFFSTYPEYDINNDQVPDNGGIISSFTINSVNAHCGELTFTIPKMQALGTPPYAPDYGFKVTKIADFWRHDVANYNTSGGIDNVIAASQNHVFYKGTDGRLQHLYPTSYNAWVHEWKTNWNDNSENVGRSISVDATANHVFYEGADGRLHHYYYAGNGQWFHEWKTDWSSNDQNVSGTVASNSDATHVFYRGADGKLHHYYFGAGQWFHEWKTDWSSNSQDVGFGGGIAVNSAATDVFYQGVDNRLHRYHYAGNAVWQHDIISSMTNSNENVNGSISCNGDGSHVFYRGSDGKLHHYYYGNGQWFHAWNTDWNSNNQDVGGQVVVNSTADHVFYRGVDGQVHQSYYTGNGVWVHDYIICYLDLTSSSQVNYAVAYDGDKIFYAGVDNSVQTYYFNNGCIPRALQRTTQNNPENNLLDVTTNSMQPINRIIESNIQLYPIPCTDEVNIKFNGDERRVVEVKDLLGATVFKTTSTNSLLPINTTNWASGIYVIVVKNVNNEIITVQKITKL